ncbi:Mitochondrial import inner membrane translocase subunit TIM50 [Chamberlinius hualienensis]
MASSICGCMLLRRLANFTRISNVSYSSVSKKILLSERSIFYKYETKLRSLSEVQRRYNGTENKPSTVAAQVQPTPAADETSSSSSPKWSRSEEEKNKHAKTQWKVTKYTLLGLTVFFACSTGWLLMVWGSPNTDENGKEINDEFSSLPKPQAYLYRAWKELKFYNKMIQDPSRDTLLPDPLKEPYYQPPYTLVIEMTDVLVHPDWTYKTGWRFKKRPGVDYFLQQVGAPLFEVVIFTSEQGLTAYPILESLDPKGYIMYKLFRDSTRYHEGHHVKDLSGLNRDLSKVIFVDWNEKSFQFQPENALKLKRWSGNDDDGALFDLAVFLRTLVSNEVEDVRTVLAFYKEFDDPLYAFKENQRRLEEEEENRLKQQMNNNNSRSYVQSWSSGLLGRRR